MKYLTFLLVLTLGFPAILMSQEFSREFGNIGKAEINLSQCSSDESAEAVVLFDIGKSYFVRRNDSYDVVFERTTRIKIFSEAGLEWAEIEIPLYQEDNIYEKTYDIEAYTYNYENGILHKTKLNTSNCHTEKINEYWVVKKFAMPNVKEGSIIEYKYKVNSEYKFNLKDWEFQWRIPVLYSEYQVNMIPFYEYTYLLQGANKFDSQTTSKGSGPRQFGPVKFKDVVYNFVMKDVPAFNSEEYIASINDYIIKIDFQLGTVHLSNGSSINVLTTWPDLIKDLTKRSKFSKYAKKSEKHGSKLLKSSGLTFSKQQEAFNYIMQYVKENYTWNNLNGKYASKSPDEFVKDKFGNSADINLFVVGLLNAWGIEAYPVIISTRENGKIRYDYPFHHFFNYVLIYAKIDGEFVLADATETNNINNRIPPRCINGKGLVINNDKVDWISLQTSIPSEIKTKITIDCQDKYLKANIETTATEYDALEYRNKYGGKVKNVNELLSDKNYHLVDSLTTIKNQMNTKEPYIVQYTIEETADKINDKIYIAPFFHETIATNPLVRQKRTFPIDMTYPTKRAYNSVITIPTGYTVDFIPDDYKIKNELFELDYIVTTKNQTITIYFDYYFRKSIYSAADYTKVRFYFNELVKKGNEKIVLSKE